MNTFVSIYSLVSGGRFVALVARRRGPRGALQWNPWRGEGAHRDLPRVLRERYPNHWHVSSPTMAALGYPGANDRDGKGVEMAVGSGARGAVASLAASWALHPCGTFSPEHAERSMTSTRQPPSPRPPARMSKADRREQLLDTAADLLLRHGLESLTMEGVAQGAGASKTLGYAYFANIDDVILSLRTRELGILYHRIEAATEEATAFRERLHALFAAYFATVAERGMLLHELEQAVNARRISAERPDGADPDDGTMTFLDWLAGLIDEEFSVGRRRAWGYAAVVASSANAHAAIWAPSGFSRRHIERTATAFALGGLRAAIAADDA